MAGEDARGSGEQAPSEAGSPALLPNEAAVPTPASPSQPSPGEPAQAPTAPIPLPSAAAPRPAWETWGLVACAVLAIVAWDSALLGMGRRWFAEGSYYSHGPLIPLIVGWLLWRDKDGLRAARGPGNWVAVPVVALGTWLLYVGILERTRAVQQYGFLVALAGVTVAFFGLSMLRRTWFAFAFAAAFMVPLAGVVLQRLTLGLKLSVTAATFKALEVLAVPAVLRGDTIHFRGHVGVRVDDVCSGLRSLVALLAMAALLAWLQRSRLKAALMVVLAVPIAMIGNGVRIGILSWLAARGTPAEPDTLLHDLTGYAVYVVSLGLLLALAGIPASAPESQSPTPSGAPHGPPRPHVAVAAGAVLLVALAISFVVPSRARPPATRFTEAIPAAVGSWTSSDLKLPPNIQRALRSGDYVVRNYTAPGIDAPLELMVLHSDGTDLHPPDACYTLQGLVERERGLATLPTPSGPIQVNRAVVEGEAGAQSLIYFWYRIEGRHEVSELAFQTRSAGFARRLVGMEGIPITTMRISTAVRSDKAAADARVTRFMEEVLARHLGSLP